MGIKTENQIYYDMVSILNQALSDMSVNGFSVIQSDQSVNLSPDIPVILMDRYYSKRYGWQGRKYVQNNGDFQQVQSYFLDMHFQIRALKRRSGSLQTPDVSTSNDALQSIITWLSSLNGVEYIQNLGYNSLRVVDVRENSFIDKTNLYEKSPSFTLVLTLYQETEVDQDYLSAIQGEIINV